MKSRQQKYQERHAAAGLCRYCTRKAVMGGLCLDHAVKRRNYKAGLIGASRQYNCRSRKLEAWVQVPKSLAVVCAPRM